MLNKRVKGALSGLLILGIVLAIAGAANAGTNLHGLTAIQSVPQLGEKNFALEAGAANAEVFHAGVATGFWGVSVGAAVLQDNAAFELQSHSGEGNPDAVGAVNGLENSGETTTLAAALTIPLGDHTRLTTGFAYGLDDLNLKWDPRADGSSWVDPGALSKPKTWAVKLRAEF